MSRPLAAIAVVAAAAPGCGLGWIDNLEDRTAGLPTSGAGPYHRLDVDDATPALEPVVVADRNADLADPTALPRDDGGFRVWFTRTPAATTASEIAYAEAPSPHDALDVGPMTVLAASAAWEEGRVAAPSVLVDGDQLVMYYEAGLTTPAIGVARSTDGVTWQAQPGPVLAAAAAPSAVVVDGVTWLFVTRPDAPGIWRAVETDAGFVLDPAPAVVARPEVDKAFDRQTVFDPAALAVTTRDGSTLVKLWFAGTTYEPADRPAIGFAASFDGLGWPRYGGAKPMLVADAVGPTTVLSATGGLMLFAEISRGHLAITAAETP